MAAVDCTAVEEIERAFVSPWDRKQIGDELVAPRSVALVLENDRGAILGWCCARAVCDEAELLKIAIRDDHRKRGLGSRLFAELERILSSRGVHRLYLEVRAENRSALQFYAKHGFMETGRRTGYYVQPIDDACLMVKSIRHGTSHDEGADCAAS